MADEELYEVERILKDNGLSGEKRFYWVKWKGYSHSDNTWEPIEGLSHLRIWREYERSKGRNPPKKNQSDKSDKSDESDEDYNSGMQNMYILKYRIIAKISIQMCLF